MPNPDLKFDIDEVLGGIDEHLAGFGLHDHHYLGVKRVETDFSWKLNMDTFHEFYHFDALHPDRPVVRCNWLLHTDPELFMPFGREGQQPRVARADPDGPIYLRTERQTLVRLPRISSAVALSTWRCLMSAVWPPRWDCLPVPGPVCPMCPSIIV